MIIPVCCIHNFMLQNYIASCVLLVYKLQRCVPKLRILLLIHERGINDSVPNTAHVKK